jgi:AcrR family transcriptional regulator
VAAPRRTPRTTTTTTDDLLEAGAGLLREHFAHASERLGDGFQFLSPTEVAHRAGVSKGMLYHLWGDGESRAFDNFVAALAATAIVEANDADALQAEVTKLLTLGLGFARTVAALGEAELASLAVDDERRIPFLQQLAFTAYAGCEPIRRALASAATDSYQYLAPFYQRTLDACERRLKPPSGPGRALTMTDFARAISCLTEGFASEVQYFPDLVDDQISWRVDGTAESLTLYAISLIGLVEHLTEPFPTD